MSKVSNIQKRVAHITVDEYGIDPLQDSAMAEVRKIRTAYTHTVVEDEARNAPLISYRNYGSVDLWWIIMGYNALLDMDELVPGMHIQLPDQGSVVDALVLSVERKGTPNVIASTSNIERKIKLKEW